MRTAGAFFAWSVHIHDLADLRDHACEGVFDAGFQRHFGHRAANAGAFHANGKLAGGLIEINDFDVAAVHSQALANHSEHAFDFLEEFFTSFHMRRG